MSYTSLAMKFGTSVMALSLGACSAIDTRVMGLPQQRVTVSEEVIKDPIVLNPCEANHIKNRPATYVTQREIDWRTREGEVGYFYNGFIVYGTRSFFERLGTVGGAAAGGVAANTLVTGSAQALATTGGVAAGLVLGEFFANSARLSRLARESGCEAYIDKIGPAPIRKFIGNAPADRPHGAPARVFDNNSQYEVQIAPYSATSPGGSRDPNRGYVPRGRCFGC